MEKRSQRRAYRLFLAPRLQLKYGAYYAAIALVALMCWNALSIFFLIQLIDTSAVSDPGLTIGQNLIETLRQNIWVVALGMTAIGFMFMGLAIALSKNVVGPMKALLRHIQELNSGNYDAKTMLRKNDELKPIMHALNELSATLRTRHGQTPENPDLKRVS